MTSKKIELFVYLIRKGVIYGRDKLGKKYAVNEPKLAQALQPGTALTITLKP